MDAGGLEEERIHACSFMVMTGDGPISMCMHNAKRDDFILKPVKVAEGVVWDPLTGRESPAAQTKSA
jgi:7,8-dihydro-6-hydroxymethylpterin dimethyltransferase